MKNQLVYPMSKNLLPINVPSEKYIYNYIEEMKYKVLETSAKAKSWDLFLSTNRKPKGRGSC